MAGPAGAALGCEEALPQQQTESLSEVFRGCSWTEARGRSAPSVRELWLRPCVGRIAREQGESQPFVIRRLNLRLASCRTLAAKTLSGVGQSARCSRGDPNSGTTREFAVDELQDDARPKSQKAGLDAVECHGERAFAGFALKTTARSTSVLPSGHLTARRAGRGDPRIHPLGGLDRRKALLVPRWSRPLPRQQPLALARSPAQSLRAPLGVVCLWGTDRARAPGS
jgi:hypothetical protein